MAAFYYWKTHFETDSAEWAQLDRFAAGQPLCLRLSGADYSAGYGGAIAGRIIRAGGKKCLFFTTTCCFSAGRFAFKNYLLLWKDAIFCKLPVC